MMRKLLLILAIVALLTVPASAEYTLLWSDYLNSTSTTTIYMSENPGFVFNVDDIAAAAANITHAEFDWGSQWIHSYPATLVQSGSYAGDIYTSPTSTVIIGNYSATWENTTAGIHIEVDFSNWDIDELTGQKKGLHLDGLLGGMGGAGWNTHIIAMDPPDLPNVLYFVTGNTGQNAIAGFHQSFGGSLVEVPIADFNGTPLSGAAPLYVAFHDNSTGGGTMIYNWTITGPSAPFIQTPAGEDTLVYFNTAGNYTVSHGVSNELGSDIETKTDYIWIYDDNSTATTQYGVIDYVTGYMIHGAQIDLNDIENTSWTNTTSTNGYGSITTLLSHHINAYASAAGFEDNDRLNDPAWDGQTYWIMLHPVNWTQASAGNVTLFVNVWDKLTNARINGAAVTIATPNYSQGKHTNTAGVAQFEVPNQTTVLIDVKALGQEYKGAVKMVNTGDGNGGEAAVEVTFLLEKNTVTPTPAITTLPGGGTPTATVTIDPYPCDAEHPKNCARKQDEMANMVVQFGPLLVNLFIIATVIGVMKMMGIK